MPIFSEAPVVPPGVATNYLTSQAGPPNPLTTFVTPLVYDTTAVTGGLYAWTTAGNGTYVHVSAVVS